MRPLRVGRWLCALVLAAAGTAPAQAAWDNVFQVTCWRCKQRPSVSSYQAFSAPSACCAPACPPPAPCCTTQYVQRSFYQPVTCMQTQSYYEPVTSYRTSYFWEPVTSFRASCYFDPCTCSYRQVTTPVTSYRLRSQCCATTSYLQRTCQVPVTSYRLSYYMEPVTTCSAPPACPTPCPQPQPQPCCSNNGSAAPTPGVAERPSTPPAGVYEQPNQNLQPQPQPQPQTNQQYYPPSTSPPPTMPPAGNSTHRPTGPAPVAPAPAPTVRLERIVSVPTPPAANGSVDGQVVQVNNAPRGGAQLTFVRADQQDSQQPVTTDGSGKFNVQLAAGDWLVYMTGSDGKPVYHSRIDVRGESRSIVLVSR